MKKFECDIPANQKEWLYQKYVIDKRSLRSIAKECEVSDDTIKTRLNKFNIHIRNRQEISGLGYYNVSHKQTEKSLNHYKSMKIERIIVFCENCGKEILTLPTKKRKFCSTYCKNIYLRNHVDRNQSWRDYPEYDIWRKSVYKRDNWKCKICNKKQKINAHHIFFGAINEDKRFNLSNGITLCEKHHIQIHKNHSSFIQECIKKTSNIGETPEVDNPEALIREFLLSLIRSNDYQEESRKDYGIVWSANITNEIAEIDKDSLSL